LRQLRTTAEEVGAAPEGGEDMVRRERLAGDDVRGRAAKELEEPGRSVRGDRPAEDPRSRSQLHRGSAASLAVAGCCLAISSISLSAGARAQPALTDSRAPSLIADTATTVTDDAGIPHITAPNFGVLGYGEAWASGDYGTVGDGSPS
jgi:hypothetical protein